MSEKPIEQVEEEQVKEQQVEEQPVPLSICILELQTLIHYIQEHGGIDRIENAATVNNSLERMKEFTNGIQNREQVIMFVSLQHLIWTLAIVPMQAKGWPFEKLNEAVQIRKNFQMHLSKVK